MIPSRTTWVIVAAMAVASATCGAPQARAAGIKNSDDPARREKAMLYLKRAGELLGNAKDPQSTRQGPWSELDAVRRSMACTQALLGDIDGAKKTVELIGDWKDRIRALAEIADIQAKAGNQAAAKETLAAADQVKTPAGKERSRPEAFIGAARARMGDIAGAETIAKALGEPSEKASVWTAIAGAKARAGDKAGARAALAAAREMLKGEHDGLVEIEMAQIQWEMGDQVAARETVNTSISDKVNRAWTWTYFAGVEAAQRPADAKAAAAEARQILSEIVPDKSNDGMKVKLSANICRILARDGDRAGAKELLSEAIKGNDALEERVVGPLFEIALAQKEMGDEPAYRATLKKALDRTQKLPVGLERTMVWSSVAAALAEAGDMPGAAEAVVRWMGEPEMSSADAAVIAMAMAQSAGAKADLAWIEKLKTPQQKAHAYAAAAMGMVLDKPWEAVSSSR